MELFWPSLCSHWKNTREGIGDPEARDSQNKTVLNIRFDGKWLPLDNEAL